MMYGAQGEAVDDSGDAALLSVLDDVSGLDQSRLAECADGAAVPVSAQHVLSEALLVKAKSDLRKGVRADVRGRDEPLAAHVGCRKPHLEEHACAGSVVPSDEDRLDDHVLTGGNAVEVNQGRLELERRPESSIIRLVS